MKFLKLILVGAVWVLGTHAYAMTATELKNPCPSGFTYTITDRNPNTFTGCCSRSAATVCPAGFVVDTVSCNKDNGINAKFCCKRAACQSNGCIVYTIPGSKTKSCCKPSPTAANACLKGTTGAIIQCEGTQGKDWHLGGSKGNDTDTCCKGP